MSAVQLAGARTALRLEALAEYEILDTPEEEQFDELASFAADIFNAPIAAITLIDDDRQWFKARVGIEARETPLNLSMCAHGLLAGDLLVVPDATKDDRFKCNPLVAGESGLRFYAGARLVTPSGVPLGMICVADLEPRAIVTEQQSKMLRILARQVVTQLELRRECLERTKREQALRESELLHRSILEASVDCIKVISPEGTLELINRSGIRALEIDSFEAVRGKAWTSLWPSVSRNTVMWALQEARSGKVARFTGFCHTAKGTPKWWDVVVTPMMGEDGTVLRLLSISRDVTLQRETSDQLRWASEHDALTSLPNRRSFQAQLQAATIRAMESGGLIGLMLIDLDHFKHVNDTLGHSAGDHLLKTFGERLRSSVRGTDLVARLGGDEFAVILEGVKSQHDLLRLGESILSRLSAPIVFDGRVISAGASIGGALFPNDASNANDLIKCADSALYALKGSGRGGTRMFHNYMREEAQKVASQLNLARIAISEQSVVPHYQQKVDLKSGKICGFEALLRWQHPTRGMQQPDTVAEAFKDYELASKIGELMQNKVFSDMRDWQRAGIDFGRVSINASPAEFLRDDYAEKLLARADDYQIPKQLIEVEVTEHVFLERGAEYVSRALTQLNSAGVRLSLDDFGTGYSSLSHLFEFPVDVVKIDRSFIAKLVNEPEIASIVTAVIDLAASLRLEVVAEGIETPAQAEALRDRGCTLGQGFLFGRAVVGDEVPILMGR